MHLWTRTPGSFGIRCCCGTHRSVSSSKLPCSLLVIPGQRNLVSIMHLLSWFDNKFSTPATGLSGRSLVLFIPNLHVTAWCFSCLTALIQTESSLRRSDAVPGWLHKDPAGNSGGTWACGRKGKWGHYLAWSWL